MPCTGHRLVTTRWLGARTFGCKNAAVVVSLKEKRALTQLDPSSQQEFLPFGVPHEQTAQLFQQSQEGWES